MRLSLNSPPGGHRFVDRLTYRNAFWATARCVDSLIAWRREYEERVPRHSGNSFLAITSGGLPHKLTPVSSALMSCLETDPLGLAAEFRAGGSDWASLLVVASLFEQAGSHIGSPRSPWRNFRLDHSLHDYVEAAIGSSHHDVVSLVERLVDSPEESLPFWHHRWEFAYTSPEEVDWIALGDCEQRCLFCFGDSWRKTGSVSLEDIAQGFAVLRAGGTKGIVISGGEPALHRDFHDILQVAAAAGFERITLSTKGEHLDRVLDELLAAKRSYVERGEIVMLSNDAALAVEELKTIDAIGLPLDGDRALHNAMRPIHQNAPRAEQDASYWATLRLARELPTLLDGFPGIKPHSRESQLSVTVRVMLGRPNYRGAYRLVDALADAGCNGSAFRLKIRRYDGRAATYAGRGAARALYEFDAAENYRTPDGRFRNHQFDYGAELIREHVRVRFGNKAADAIVVHDIDDSVENAMYLDSDFNVRVLQSDPTDVNAHLPANLGNLRDNPYGLLAQIKANYAGLLLGQVRNVGEQGIGLTQN